MRNEGRFAVALVMALSAMLFAASCAKRAVQSQAVSVTGPVVRKADVQKAEVRETEVRKAEVRKVPDRPAEMPVQAKRADDDRLRADAAAREAAKWVFVNEHVAFAFGSSLLSEDARRILHGKAEFLRTNPSFMITVEGHCDERGTNAYNVALGERRAESVKSFLVEKGIGAIRLNTVSYGKERPVAAGHDEASWARNRRAQFVIN